MLNQAQDWDFVLTGAKTGETVLLGKHSFVNGVAVIRVSPENAAAILTFMARSYQAFPEGSPELEQAQERDRLNGILSRVPNDPAPPYGASAPVQGAGVGDASGPLSDSRALHSSVDAASEAGREGLVPGGAGHENAGLGERVESRAQRESDAIIALTNVAISKLDPTQDNHWTEGGLPSVEYLAEATKNPNLTRQLVELCAPGFNRIVQEDLLAGRKPKGV